MKWYLKFKSATKLNSRRLANFFNILFGYFKGLLNPGYPLGRSCGIFYAARQGYHRDVVAPTSIPIPRCKPIKTDRFDEEP